MGLSQKLPRLIGINRAKELSLTGNYLTAERAYEWGLVNRVVAPDELLPTCKALARDILTTDPATRSEIRRIMDQGWYSTLGEGMAIELDANRAHAQRELTPEKVASRRRPFRRAVAIRAADAAARRGPVGSERANDVHHPTQRVEAFREVASCRRDPQRRHTGIAVGAHAIAHHLLVTEQVRFDDHLRGTFAIACSRLPDTHRCCTSRPVSSQPPRLNASL